jgi:hypothetical protein
MMQKVKGTTAADEGSLIDSENHQKRFFLHPRTTFLLLLPGVFLPRHYLFFLQASQNENSFGVFGASCCPFTL